MKKRYPGISYLHFLLTVKTNIKLTVWDKWSISYTLTPDSVCHILPVPVGQSFDTLPHLRVFLLVLKYSYPYSEFFWSVFSRIWTEYREIRIISLRSIWMQENTDQKNYKYGHFSRSVFYYFCGSWTFFQWKFKWT